MPGRYKAARCGFTLVELIIVILLMGIVAAVVQPRFSGALMMYRADAAAQRLATDLRYAATLARVSGKGAVVRFYPGASDTESYYRFDEHGDPNVPGRSMVPEDNSTWYTVRLSNEPYQATLASAPAILTFDIYGLPDCDAEFLVTVGSQQRTIRLTRTDAKVVIE